MDNHDQRQQTEEQKANPNTGSDSSGDIEAGQQTNASSTYMENLKRVVEATRSRDQGMENLKRVVEAIRSRDQDKLKNLLSSNPAWKDLRDTSGRTPLHYAASLGHYEGVCYFLGKCGPCIILRDNYGYHPLHLASEEGHVRIVRELIKHSSDPAEIVDTTYGRNILHMAALTGKFKVVKYILKTPELGKMINRKDVNGNTPLHLASLHCHLRIVHALTWNKNVDLTLLNEKGLTALDVVEELASQGNLPLSQQLAWIALKSAGAPSHSKIPKEKKDLNPEHFKDRINTLTVVSTLIITATFAAGFTLPGGNSGSDTNTGVANMINRSMFYLFIFSITISMYGAIIVTIILIWAQLGDLNLAVQALKVAAPLLGVTLGTLSLSFLAGVYLVISKLTWLAITFLVISAVLVFMVVLVYALLFLPSSSSNPVMRYISYFPFILLARVAEPEKKAS